MQLLGGFRATDGAHRPLDLPTSTWRLVAFLALAGRAVGRSQAAGSLWMDKPEPRAQANLRSCLWRVRQGAPGLVTCGANHLRIADRVSVDVWDLARFARHLADRDREVDLAEVDYGWFADDLLPDWYDDFVEIEREQLRQLRLHSLEALAARLQRAGATHRALDTALSAVAASPLRESAHRLVITLHLDEGNVSEALRQYERLAGLLRSQLGIRPSAAARRLVEPWLSAGTEHQPIMIIDGSHRAVREPSPATC